MTTFSPREIVSELDRYIVGQKDAKRAVAIALRNRWRRQQLTGAMREEVLPKNILMIGPTGCGKTEIARRLAKLANAPFLKVEATKFTEVGYVGRDVESIVRDLVEVGIAHVRAEKRKSVQAKAELAAEERVLDALVGSGSSPATRDSFRRKLRMNELNDKEIEVELKEASSGLPMFELPGMPGASVGAINLGDIFGKAMGGRGKSRRLTVGEAYGPLINEEADKLLDQDAIVQDAVRKKVQHAGKPHGVLYRFSQMFDGWQILVLAPGSRPVIDARVRRELGGGQGEVSAAERRSEEEVRAIRAFAHSRRFRYTLRFLSWVTGDNGITVFNVGILTGAVMATEKAVIFSGFLMTFLGAAVGRWFVNTAMKKLAAEGT